jgi:hypothetical protein
MSLTTWRTAYATSRHKETVTVALPGHLPIVVHNFGDTTAQKYDFIQSRFGVVKLLSDDGLVMDKSPLCLQLDSALLAMRKGGDNAAKS